MKKKKDEIFKSTIKQTDKFKNTVPKKTENINASQKKINSLGDIVKDSADITAFSVKKIKTTRNNEDHFGFINQNDKNYKFSVNPYEAISNGKVFKDSDKTLNELFYGRKKELTPYEKWKKENNPYEKYWRQTHKNDYSENTASPETEAKNIQSGYSQAYENPKKGKTLSDYEINTTEFENLKKEAQRVKKDAAEKQRAQDIQSEMLKNKMESDQQIADEAYANIGKYKKEEEEYIANNDYSYLSADKVRKMQKEYEDIRDKYSKKAYQYLLEGDKEESDSYFKEAKKADLEAKAYENSFDSAWRNEADTAINNMDSSERDLFKRVYMGKNYYAGKAIPEGINIYKTKENAITELKKIGYSDEDIKKISQYVKYADDEEVMKQEEEKARNLAEKDKVLGTVSSFFGKKLNPLAVLEIIDAEFDDRIINENSILFAPGKKADAIRDEIKENTDIMIGGENGIDVFDLAYDLGTNTVDYMTSKALFSSGASLVNGISNGLDETRRLVEMGMDSNDAIGSGIAKGTLDYIFDKISYGNLDNIKNLSINTIKGIAGTIGKNVLLNITDEGITSIAYMLYDAIQNKDFSRYSSLISKYESYGYDTSEARELAKKDLFLDIVRNVTIGGLRGLITGGGYVINNYIHNLNSDQSPLRTSENDDYYQNIDENLAGNEKDIDLDEEGDISSLLQDNGYIDNIKKHSLSDVDARKWYLEKEKGIYSNIDKNLSLEEQAKQAFNMRNTYRTQARELMKNYILADKLNKTEPNLTWEKIIQKQIDNGLSGNKIYEEIIESSMRSRKDVNKKLGLWKGS